MTFNRAKAEKSLIQILKTRADKNGNEQPWRYENKVIPLINPLLVCYFVESAAADSLYAKNKVYDVAIDFLDYSLRRELLLENISEFNIKLFEGKIICENNFYRFFKGPLPSTIIFGLMENDRFDGSYDKSVIRFERHGLQRSEIQFDSQPIITHPLKMNGQNCNNMFMSYLQNTNRFQNPFQAGSLSQEDFEKYNFLIFTNLKADNYKHGQLTLKLNFERLLTQKLLCIFVPIWERKVSFDSYFNASVTN